MKVLAIVAMFAFVAVQFSHTAPTPEDEKKDSGVVPVAAAVADSAPQPAVDAKSGASDPTASPVEAVPHAEEKKA